jgi:hypothetical protein
MWLIILSSVLWPAASMEHAPNASVVLPILVTPRRLHAEAPDGRYQL